LREAGVGDGGRFFDQVQRRAAGVAMMVVAGMDPRLPLREVGAYAARVEQLGFDALHVPETVNDSLVVSALALEHTDALVVRTSMTVAFVRSPMQLALTAWSLAAMAPGRFALGLGSQIRANIVERHGMTWTDPVARMADTVAAVRACFDAFATGGVLDHRGPVFALTRLQQEFRPAPIDGPSPEVWLGAVNAAMCRVAGAVADGLVTHPTNSGRDHLDSVTRPALERGAASAARSAPPIIVAPPVVTGRDRDAVAASLARRLPRLAFVLSTPAYEPTLRRLGHEAVAASLREVLRDGVGDLAALLPLDVVEELCVAAPLDDLAEVITARYGSAAAGVLLRPPDDTADDPAFAAQVAEIAISPGEIRR